MLRDPTSERLIILYQTVGSSFSIILFCCSAELGERMMVAEVIKDCFALNIYAYPNTVTNLHSFVDYIFYGLRRGGPDVEELVRT